MSIPIRHYQAFMAKRPADLYPKAKPLNIRIIRTYLLFTISYRTRNRRTKVQRLQTCFFHHMILLLQSAIQNLAKKFGGGGRDRTDDPLLAKQVLSQLSYAPVRYRNMVGLGGLEPPTSRLSSARSNQLSYKPESYTGFKRQYSALARRGSCRAPAERQP